MKNRPAFSEENIGNYIAQSASIIFDMENQVDAIHKIINLALATTFHDPALAFRLAFANKCDDAERPVVAEYFQRCFDRELEAGDPSR